MREALLSASPADLHTPVLSATCVELLAPALQAENSVFIDATLGLGGHTEAILRACPQVKVIGIDRDTQAIELATQRLQPFGERFQAVHATYDEIGEVASTYGTAGKVQGILFDLGVSSLQIDAAERGFSYAQDAPLDMRMNLEQEMTAASLLAEVEEAELSRILREYGEEKYAGRIARAIIRARTSTPLQSTAQLVEIIRAAIPAPARRRGGNPAKRSFQAIRIAVNNELQILSQAIPAALRSLALEGRLVVESYQSLEDRIVKQIFTQGLRSRTPVGLPVELAEDQPYLQALVRGAQKASSAEIAANPRAASVRLRAVQLIREIPDCASFGASNKGENK